MRIQIIHKGKSLSILCQDHKQESSELYLYGTDKSIYDNLRLYELDFQLLEQEENLIISITEHMQVIKQEIRISNRCRIAELAIGEKFCAETGGRTYLYEGSNKCTYMIGDEIHTEIFEPETVVYPYIDIPIKEIKVRLHHTDTGNCLEVWQSEIQNKKTIWFGRHTYGSHIWYYLSDAPYGYCEPDYPVNPGIEFICCDEKWNEVHRDSNNPVRQPFWFLSLEELCISKWNHIKGNYPGATKDGFCDWLDIKMPGNVSYDDKINWRSHRYAFIDPDNIVKGLDWIQRVTHPSVKTEVLCNFEYLNKNYRIARIAKKHLLCDAIWYEYVALNPEPDSDYVAWYAYEYNIQDAKQPEN